MTKHSIILTSTFLILLPVSISFSYGQNPFTLKNQRTSDIVMEFSLPSYTINSFYIDGKPASSIKVSSGFYPVQRGVPLLPYFAQKVMIGASDEVSVTVSDIEYTDNPIDCIEPSKGIITRNIDPATIPYSFGEMYENNQWYPGLIARKSNPFILRDIRGITVYVNPFHYNPIQKSIRIISKMTITVQKTSQKANNAFQSTPSSLSHSFHRIYQEQFINYTNKSRQTNTVEDGDKMIVISPVKFIPHLQPFIDWKNQIGIRTKLYEYPTDIGGTGADAIRAFLLDKYNSEKMTYVLLVGDHEDIPSILSEDYGVSDPSFALLSGMDSYPDLFIGRFSSPFVSDVTSMVNKVLAYEAVGSGTYYEKGLGIASDEDGNTGRKDWQWMELFRKSLISYGYTTFDTLYGSRIVTAANVITSLNLGRGLVCYMGHGSIDGWSTTGFNSWNIQDLDNNSMTPIIFSVACNNGEFDGTCFAEAFTRIPQKGAVVFTGSSVLMDWVPPQYAMQETIRLLCSEAYLSGGALFYNGEIKMLDMMSSEKTFRTWIYFGDPSVMVRTKTPMQITATHSSSISKNFTITFGSSIEGRACIWSKSTGIIDEKTFQGTSVSLNPLAQNDGQQLILTVVGTNCIPYSKTLPVNYNNSIQNNTSPSDSKRTVIFGPNPCNKNNTIFFSVQPSTFQSVRIKIIDQLGALIYDADNLNPWNLRNKNGRFCGAGVFVVMITIKTPQGLTETFKEFLSIKQ